MFNSDTELLFPIRVIPSLQDLRGQEWQVLIGKLSTEDADSSDKIAFTAMIVKLAGCTGCNADSFRAMRGCTQCSRLTIKRYKGTDADLMQHYRECQKEVKAYLSKRDQ
ncbi:MAG: hypothetical protein C0401_00725 [Anaerolinea sp.]|nr:hypothetical protein [Anaerolinea sp.]